MSINQMIESANNGDAVNVPAGEYPKQEEEVFNNDDVFTRMRIQIVEQNEAIGLLTAELRKLRKDIDTLKNALTHLVDGGAFESKTPGCYLVEVTVKEWEAARAALAEVEK